MEADLKKEGNELIVKVTGSLDTAAAPELDQKLNVIDDTIEKVTFDFNDLEYIASSGLRLMIKVLKIPGPKRTVKVVGAKDYILEVLNATGLDELMEIA